MKRYKIPIIAAALLLTACSAPADFGEVYVAQTDGRVWERGKPVYLYMENTHTLSLRDITMLVRFTDDFKYDKLLLTVETLTPGRVSWVDTLSVEFTPGKQYSEASAMFRAKALFGQTGGYRFAVRHVMPVVGPEAGIEGVAGVGIQIEQDGKR